MKLWAILCFGFILAAQERERDDQQAARQAWFYNQRAYPLGRIPAGARLSAMRGLQRRIAPNSSTWTAIGPQPTNSYTLGNSVSGRVNAIAIDPRSDNTVYIGAAEGGVWKTTDGGNTWTPLTDGQASLASGAIALDPTNPDTVYVGTGEQNFSGDSYYGAGILKSTDAGATWTNIVGPFLLDQIGAIVVNPANTQIVLCASDQGVWRSSDGGQTWTKTLTGTATDLALDPGAPESVYAAIGYIAGAFFGINGNLNGVYHSTDGGLTWQALTGFPAANAGRIRIAMAPSQTKTIYAQIQDSPETGNYGAYPWGSLLGIYKTTDGGNTWTDTTTAADLANLYGYDYDNQLWYDNAIAVSPQNPDVVYAGATGVICSLDGGQTWSPVLDSIHVDTHAFAFTQDGSLLYIGTDGGMYSARGYATSTVSAASLNATLALSQFYPGISIHPQNPGFALGGTQDNGTQLFTGSAEWTLVACGDGGFTAIDPSFPSFAYAACQYINIGRTLDLNAGALWVEATYGIDPADPVDFIPPLAMDAANPQTLYFGTYRLYRSPDSAGIWYAVSPDLTGGKQGVLTTIAVAPSDSKTVYCGTSNAHVQASNNIQLGAQATWTDQSAGLPQRWVTKIAVDPIDAATAYVTFSGFAAATGPQGHVYMTTTGGASWTDISGNLPNIPVNDLVVDPDLSNTLYIGTDAGVMATTDGGTTWSNLGSGLPQVVVLSLVLHRPTRTLRAGTHGRSAWDIAVPLPGATAQPSIASISPATVNVGGAAFPLAVTGAGFIASTTVLWNGQSLPANVADSTSLTVQIPASYIAGVGRASVAVFNPVSGGGASNAEFFLIGPAPQSSSNAFVSAANPTGGSALSQGSIASLYGVNLSGQAVVADLPPPLPVILGGTLLSIGGEGAPLFYVSPGQINFQVPFINQEVTGPTQVPLTIVQGTQSTTISVTVTPYSPGLFTTNQGGTGQGSTLINGTASIAAPTGAFPGSRPAHTGEYVSIYGTGLGGVNEPVFPGIASPSNPLAHTVATPAVTIGGVSAPVQFSGLAPGYVGLYQVNAQVPCTAPTGPAIPISLNIGGIASPFGDNFQVPPYLVSGLANQSPGTAGFAGLWTQLLQQDLIVIGSGAVGRPTVTANAAGDYIGFAAPLTLGAGQLFISYDIANQLSSNFNSTRLDLNLDNPPVGGRRALIGAVGAGANFNLTVESGLGTAAIAQTGIASTGAHRLLAVLDAANHQIALFVDPGAKSFYNSDGTNNADAVAPWTPAAGLAFGSYSLVENQSDQATFGGVVFSGADTSALDPIATTIGGFTSNTATIAVDQAPSGAAPCAAAGP